MPFSFQGINARECSQIFSHLSIDEGLSANHVKAILRDRNGFLWIGTTNGLNRYDGMYIKKYVCQDVEKNRGNNNIGKLYEDGAGNVWIGTDRGVYIYSPKTDKISYVDIWDNLGDGFMNWVQDIEGDDKGNIWVLIPDMGIFRSSTGGVNKYEMPVGSQYKEDYFNDLCVADDGSLWACSSNGKLFRYDEGYDAMVEVNFSLPGVNNKLARIIPWEKSSMILATENVELFKLNLDREYSVERLPGVQADNLYLRSLELIDDELWIGTQTGLYSLNCRNGEQKKFVNNPLNPHSLSDNTVYTLYSDKEKNLWAGTMFGGVNYIVNDGFDFCSIEPYDINSRRVRGLTFAQGDSQLVIGSEANGVSILDIATNNFIAPPSILTSKCATMCVTRSGEKVLIGLEREGLFVYEPGKTPYQYLPYQLLHENTVYAYLRDRHNTEWVGMGYALYRKAEGESDFIRVGATDYNWIFTLYEASDGKIWIGTMGSGLYRYDPAEKQYKKYIYDENSPSPNSLKSNSINSIMEDSKGIIWISTDRGGLSRYNSQTDDFTTYGQHQGLPDEIVYKVLEDGKGNLWFGTNKGLARFNPETELVTVFTKADGLPANEFTYNSAVRGNDSIFYFGTINGVVRFNPEKKILLKDKYPVLFTSLSILNPEDLEGNIVYADEIKLEYDQNTFSLTIGVPTAIGLKGVKRFYYRLLPGGEDWIPMEGNRISFTNLAPGSYSLEVKMECGEVVSTNKIKLVILSPWWATGWAIACYALLLLGVVVLIFVWYRRRELKRLQERQEIFASNQEKEVYRQKLNFFTEIAHEIRTPLSLIDLPLEAMEEQGLDNPESEHYLKVTRQNTARLLELTSQLLDFQKIEAGKLRLKNEAVDINELLNFTLDRFEPSISLKEKTLVRDLPKNNLITVTDREAVTKIISNLLNNALKYAKSRISVSLSSDAERLMIKVSSDGEKIGKEESERIFETFYQTDKSQEQKNGVGIGLPLSRSLARLLGGDLYLDVEGSQENVFVLSLPVNMSEKSAEVVSPGKHGATIVYEEDSNQTPLNAKGYHVLLVEDNDGIRSMLHDRLSSSFLLTLASNGREALDILSKKSVDVVVTDIMMPEMDGLELCRQIKANNELSHIPVIFITAKNDLESKVKGLQYGAEGYIEKPFSIKYLREMVVTLLENRRRAREAFARKPFFEAANIPVNREDEKFMEKVLATIKENMSDEDFNVEVLADKMCMSRSNLLRHIKSVFNLAPGELIRVVRLKTAAELIKTGGFSLGEISRKIGISSQSYFTKMFFKQFNVMPNEFAKQMNDDKTNQNK
ncbi:MAG: response regulator [Muribaculaceae bacterium]|nr:response regulator [Muribaculaceae bacterium]MDE6754534.1 response regulator [Muribaculaceae bacterium]